MRLAITAIAGAVTLMRMVMTAIENEMTTHTRRRTLRHEVALRARNIVKEWWVVEWSRLASNQSVLANGRSDPAAFVQQARKMTLQHAFGAHSHAMSLVHSAAAASSVFITLCLSHFIGRKIAREFRIMREDAHLVQRQRVLESAPLQLTVTQRTRMLHCTCSTPLSFLACRLALADNQRDVGFGRWVIALVMKRWFFGRGFVEFGDCCRG
jgi:hypothetical protein